MTIEPSTITQGKNEEPRSNFWIAEMGGEGC